MAKSVAVRNAIQEMLDKGDILDIQKKHEAFIRNFLFEMGMRAMAQTKALTPVDTGNLRNRWELQGVFRKGEELYVVLFNPVEYASFVEDGHRQRKRWVPGRWQGNRFIYDRDAKTGMMLREKWVQGKFMARISINKIENEMPARYEAALRKFLRELSRE